MQYSGQFPVLCLLFICGIETFRNTVCDPNFWSRIKLKLYIMSISKPASLKISSSFNSQCYPSSSHAGSMLSLPRRSPCHQEIHLPVFPSWYFPASNLKEQLKSYFSFIKNNNGLLLSMVLNHGPMSPSVLLLVLQETYHVREMVQRKVRSWALAQPLCNQNGLILLELHTEACYEHMHCEIDTDVDIDILPFPVLSSLCWKKSQYYYCYQIVYNIYPLCAYQ